MPIKITTTQRHTDSVKVLVYGESGFGKTVLCGTAPNPIIISAESGLLSLRSANLPVIEIKSMDDLDEAYEYCIKESEYDTICLDSVSEIAEVCLGEHKRKFKDGRKAYAETYDIVAEKIRKFRDINHKHIYFTAKQIRTEDSDTGVTKYGPSMPGRTMTNNIEYFFDEVLCLRVGETEGGDKFRYLQTQPDIQYKAKDRSGVLDEMEPPDLTKIFNKILNEVQNGSAT